MVQRRHRRHVGPAFHPIDAPEFFAGTVDEGEACGLGTNVSLREGDLGAGGLELGRHALATLAVPIAECHARALGDETPDRRLADPPPVTTATLPSSLPCSVGLSRPQHQGRHPLLQTAHRRIERLQA